MTTNLPRQKYTRQAKLTSNMSTEKTTDKAVDKTMDKNKTATEDFGAMSIRVPHIWKSVWIMLSVGQIVVCTILKHILRLYSFPMHPSDTPNAKKLGFDPPNGGRREILPLIFKNLKIPLGCFPVLVCGPDWAQPTWR